MINVIKTFERFDNDFLDFEKIENPPCKRPDLCAFLKLNELLPGEQDIVAAAEHDEIFLDVSVEDLAKAATAEDILYLVRCGVRVGDDEEGLAMFV